jgi:RHS repeat-associated protein
VYDEGINPVFEYDTSASPTMTHRYLWSDNVDELLADEQNPGLSSKNTLWALSDHLGSIRDIADTNETTGITSIANHRRYDSTGKRISETNASVDLVFGYTGKLLDETTGLQNNLNRWLDPATGRWISQDPIGFAAGDANLYRYVGNKVSTLVDPYGLDDTMPSRGDLLDPRARDRREQQQTKRTDELALALALAEKEYRDEQLRKVPPNNGPSMRAMNSEESTEFRARQRYEDRLSLPGLTDFGADMAYTDYLRETGQYNYGYDMLRSGGGVNKALSIVAAMGGGYGPLGPRRSTPSVYPSSTPRSAPNETLTPRAARRQAMREHGIPTSQQPTGQRSVKSPDGTPAGRQYDYEIQSPYGGQPQKHSVQHSLTDDVPGHGPHWEAGQTKALGQVDSLGRPRIRNPKVKVNE